VVDPTLLAILCLPLPVCGFALAITAVSTALGESVLPAGTLPFVVPWYVENVGLIVISVVIPLAYLAGVRRMRPESVFLGYSRRFWIVCVIVCWGTGFLCGAALGVMASLVG